VFRQAHAGKESVIVTAAEMRLGAAVPDDPALTMGT
jgi:hypothetical protein